MKAAIDASERKRALDPETSFIVQAPAGSGKTELLIQRYLGLLARVNHPEEILAITFTRKAAAEMRNRVLAAMARAADDTQPQKDHEILTWELARGARKRNVSEDWQMEKYPSRMRIMTIDSLCAGLVRQMPVLSGFGAPPQITDDPDSLYARAARSTVAELEGGGNWSGSVETLVRHLDNRLAAVENLVAQMLPRRDQWLRHVANIGDTVKLRAGLESAMEAVIREALSDLRDRFPDACISDTLELGRFAADNLQKEENDSPVINVKNLTGLPGKSPQDLTAWQALAELLLTKKGEWRKKADKSLGFPAAGSAGKDAEKKALLESRKREFKNLIAELSSSPGLDAALDMVRRLPAPAYTDSQWEVVEALLEMLKLAAAHLQAVFEQAGKVDFAEMAIRARAALGTPDNPTDLALALDYRISHILIDEFQDTSISQFELMRGLTAGWSAGDGRSFFAVGDPMQSIYGFREAEVGLFLKAREHGLDEHVPLESIVLRSNFRSDAGIVEWVNSVFPRVLPEKSDADTGAVPYMPAEPVLDYDRDPAALMHPLIDADEENEAALVAECITQSLAEDPEGSVAVLVRSRPHLKAVVPELRKNGLRFSAVEIDSLSDRPVVRDLLSLTRALCHPADRTAWLAVLRAPWCGLTLNDLYALAGDNFQLSIYTLIHDESRIAAMSEDGGRRLLRVRPALDAAVSQRGRRSMRRLVEGAWLSLGGPATVADAAQLADVPVYFDYLEAGAGAGPVTDIGEFEQGVFSLFAMPDPGADPRLQIMTIHKAKGLEFDTVIIPGLGRAPRSQDPALLLWQERAGARDGESLLMAPISEAGAEKDPTYDYIQRLQQTRRDYEAGRLLYVAATRAKKNLHLLGGTQLDRAGRPCRPDSRSLLAVLWPAVLPEFEAAADAAGTGEKEHRGAPQQKRVSAIRRLSADWQLPGPPADVSAGKVKIPELARGAAESDMPRFDWAGTTLRHVGTVVHRWLRIICENGLENWGRDRVKASAEMLRADILGTGVARSDIEAALSRAEAALINAIKDETGRWILAGHRQGACEYALSGLLGHEVVNAVIDRTFVDENGLRWVIDYKSGIHSGGGLDDFLDSEQQRYSFQMERYARLMEKMDGRQVKIGLYFPMIPAWRQWETESGRKEALRSRS